MSGAGSEAGEPRAAPRAETRSGTSGERGEPRAAPGAETRSGTSGEGGGNKELARRFREDLWNSGDLAIADEIIAADCVFHARVPLSTDFVRGPDAMRQLVLFYQLAFSDIRMTVDALIAEGDTVAARWTGRGRHRGDLLGLPGGAPGAMTVSPPIPQAPLAPLFPPVSRVSPPAPWAAPAPLAETVTMGIDFLRFAGGRIVEAWVAWDILSLIEPHLHLPAESAAAFSSGPLAEFLPFLKRLR